MLENGAPIDSFGVGTRLATGANFNPRTGEGAPSALGGVYKLVESDGRPVGKQSLDEPSKATIPGKKQVYRVADADGGYVKDYVTLWDKSMLEGEPLLIPIIQDGELVYDFPSLSEIQVQTIKKLKKLPETHKHLIATTAYPVELDSIFGN